VYIIIHHRSLLAIKYLKLKHKYIIIGLFDLQKTKKKLFPSISKIHCLKNENKYYLLSVIG